MKLKIDSDEIPVDLLKIKRLIFRIQPWKHIFKRRRRRKIQKQKKQESAGKKCLAKIIDKVN